MTWAGLLRPLRAVIAEARRQGRAASAVTTIVAMSAGGVAYAAMSAQTQNTGNSLSRGSVVLTDDDGGSAMLGLTAAQPGASDTDCIELKYHGTLDAQLRHFATVSGPLAPYLDLKVTRGQGAAFGSCGGFTADTRNYFGRGAGVIYAGKLSEYPTGYATGRIDPADTGGTNSYASRVQATTGLVNHWRLGDPAPAVSSDVFTGTNGAELSTRSGSLGASWSALGTNSTTAIIASNRIRRPAAGRARYVASGVPSSANYAVEGSVYVATKLTSDAIGVVGRADPSTATYYAARYDMATTAWRLEKVVNGTTTTLGTYSQSLTAVDWFADGLYKVRLDMKGTRIRLVVDGTERIVADDSTITSAGRGGVVLGASDVTGVPSDTTGLHLDDFAINLSAAVDEEGLAHGTYEGGVTRPVAGALATDTDTAAQFDGSDDHVNATRKVQDDLSLEFWFKSTQGRSSNITHRSGAGLVSATAGTSSTLDDYGTSLSSSGQVVAGVGNPQTTLTSSAGFDDGVWHHVVFTREQATGAVALYVDGVREAQGTGGTQRLDAGATLAIGRVPGASFTNYGGTIDEVATYDRPLTPDTIAQHYNAGPPAESWSQNETHDYKFQVTLANTVAVEGLTASATFHWEAQDQ